MKIIMFLGKGGVGKSTLSVELSYLLHKMGKKVILISVDQQHNSIYLAKENKYKFDYLISDTSASDFVKRVINEIGLSKFMEYVDVIGGDYFSLLNVIHMFYKVYKDYDYVVIDFPPNCVMLSLLKAIDATNSLIFKTMTLKNRVKRLITGKDEVLDGISNIKSEMDLFKSYINSSIPIVVGIPTELGYIESIKIYNILKETNFPIVWFYLNMIKLNPSDCFVCKMDLDNQMDYIDRFNMFAYGHDDTILFLGCYTYDKDIIREDLNQIINKMRIFEWL